MGENSPHDRFDEQAKKAEESLHNNADKMIAEIERILLPILEKLGKQKELDLAKHHLNLAKDRSLNIYTRISYIDLALRNIASALGEDIEKLWGYKKDEYID